jgi:MFS family permease
MHRHRHRHPAPTARADASAVKAAPRYLLGLLALAQLMVILDISAVNVALPEMARSLRIEGGNIGWAVTSYSLVFGSLLLLGGRLADLFGGRRMFLAGLGVFTLASVGAATAGSEGTLFAARAAQGLGAAVLSPAALSILMAAFTEGSARARALGGLGRRRRSGRGRRSPARRCSDLRHRLAGDLRDQRPHRPCRGVRRTQSDPGRSPQAAAERPRSPRRRAGDSEPGTLVFALSQASAVGWGSLQTLGLGGLGLAGLAVFGVIERHTARPLLRVGRLADRGVGGGFVMMLAVSSVLFGAFLLISMYLQNLLGTGPMRTGLAFLPLAVTLAAGVHLGSHAVTRHGVRAPMASGFAVAAGGMLLLTGGDAQGSYLGDVLPGMLVGGSDWESSSCRSPCRS